MFNKKQINAIIKVLKDPAIDGRSALQQVFEQGGYIWATNGYIALELGEVNETLKNKCVPLLKLVGWSGTHTSKDTTMLTELMEDNELGEPEMTRILHKDYTKSEDPRFDARLLSIATDFLGVNLVSLEQAENNGSMCYRVKPLEDMHIMNEAMEIKAYIMGLK